MVWNGKKVPERRCQRFLNSRAAWRRWAGTDIPDFQHKKKMPLDEADRKSLCLILQRWFFVQTQPQSPLPSDNGQLVLFWGENGWTYRIEIHGGKPNHSWLRKVPPPQIAHSWSCCIFALSPKWPLVATVYLPTANTHLIFNVTCGLILCCPQVSWCLYCIELNTKRDEWLSRTYEGSRVVDESGNAVNQVGFLAQWSGTWEESCSNAQ